MATKAVALRTRTVYVQRSRRRHGKKMTIPVALIAGLAPGMLWALDSAKAGNFQGAAERLEAAYLMYDPWGNHFSTTYFWKGLGPLMIGGVVHAAAQKFGINRALGRAGVPWLRI